MVLHDQVILAKSQMITWLQESGFDDDQFIHIAGDDNVLFKIWTEKREYRIGLRMTERLRSDPEVSMVASMSVRAPRAGEDWTRGNDLPDGKFSRKLFNSIMRSIVNHEAVHITETAMARSVVFPDASVTSK